MHINFVRAKIERLFLLHTYNRRSIFSSWMCASSITNRNVKTPTRVAWCCVYRYAYADDSHSVECSRMFFLLSFSELHSRLYDFVFVVIFRIEYFLQPLLSFRSKQNIYFSAFSAECVLFLFNVRVYSNRNKIILSSFGRLRFLL